MSSMKIDEPRDPRAHATVLVTWMLVAHLFYANSPVAMATYHPVVRTESGFVRGQRHVLDSGQEVNSYLGIPYAKPPVGYLRFRHPQPIDRWKTVLNATQPPNSCYQVPDTEFGDFPGATRWNSPTPVSEDCLYLNVFVPVTDGGPARPRQGRSLAVMVWIYGGGFYSGTTTLALYDGKILAATGNVIVVSIGYRLGALGFFALNHVTAPGNAGLFDQLMALQWVHKNIGHFGGNPDEVTLFGESAGSVSVSLHLLSPLSEGKFRRAILQSGAANMPWATLNMAEAKRRSEELMFEYLGGDRKWSVEEAVTWLRSISASWIVEAQWVSRGALQFPFLPVVDGVFLPDDPVNLLRRQNFKKCPILLGSNANEGSNFLIYELRDRLDLHRTTMTLGQYVDSVAELFRYYPQYPGELNQRAIEAIVLQYMSPRGRLEGPVPEETLRNIQGLDTAVGDSQFVCPMNDFARFYADAALPVYAYYFTHRYSGNPWPRWMGVVHGDEIIFVFGEATKPKQNFTDDEKRLSRAVMLYWTNFAKTGDPNARIPGQLDLKEWPRYDGNTKEYLEISLNLVLPPSSPLYGNDNRRDVIGRGPRDVECTFWNEALPKRITITTSSTGGSKLQKNGKWMPSSIRQQQQHQQRAVSSSADRSRVMLIPWLVTAAALVSSRVLFGCERLTL